MRWARNFVCHGSETIVRLDQRRRNYRATSSRIDSEPGGDSCHSHHCESAVDLWVIVHLDGRPLILNIPGVVVVGRSIECNQLFLVIELDDEVLQNIISDVSIDSPADEWPQPRHRYSVCVVSREFQATGQVKFNLPPDHAHLVGCSGTDTLRLALRFHPQLVSQFAGKY